MFKKLLAILMVLILAGCHLDLPPGAEKHALLETKVSLDKAGALWKIPNERVEAGVSQSLLLFQNNFLLFGSAYGDTGIEQKAALLCGGTGAVLYEKDFSDYTDPTITVCGDEILIADRGTGKVHFLDETLTETGQYTFDTAGGSIYVSENGERLYRFTERDGIYMVKRHSGKAEVLLKNKAAFLYPSVQRGDMVSFSYTDLESQRSVAAVLDLKTGEIEAVPMSCAYYGAEKADDIWLAKHYGDDGTYYVGQDGAPKIIAAGESKEIYSLLPAPARILKRSFGRKGLLGMALYEMDGTFIAAWEDTSSEGSGVSAPVWAEGDNGYYFLFTEAPGKDTFVFWDISAASSGENIVFSPVEEKGKPKGAVSPALYEKAEEIGAKYGVELCIAEQTAGEFDRWQIESIYDEEKIQKALQSTETVLAAYPEGFFHGLYYGTKETVQILLGGKVRDAFAPENGGFTTFIGFATEGQRENTVGVDITDSFMEKTLHHEIMHLIDFKLQFHKQLFPEAPFSEEGWMERNPKDFSYPENRYAMPEDIPGHRDYFVDMYARTAPIEDRARIFENAMMGNTWMFAEHPPRMEKLRFLAACIRAAFDTQDWPEVTRWEEPLG